MEDEDWYEDYQSLLEFAIGDKDIITPDTLVNAFLDEYKDIFKEEYPNPERILRWAVLATERSNMFINELKNGKYKKYNLEDM